MNGPLLVTMLPPEGTWNSAPLTPENTFFVALFLLAGFLLSLLLRHPGR